MQSASVASVVSSAIQRAPLAPLTRQATAPSIGKARIAERMGKPSILMRHRPSGGGGDAEQHHQRVAVDIARLEAGGELRAGGDRRGGAVRAEPVDRPLV